MSDSVRPHRWQPIRLHCPWDSPGKNAGVGCHFLLQCIKVKSESEVAQSCPTLSDPMSCSLPGSSVHGIFQARALEWGAIAFSARGTRWLHQDPGTTAALWRPLLPRVWWSHPHKSRFCLGHLKGLITAHGPLEEGPCCHHPNPKHVHATQRLLSP